MTTCNSANSSSERTVLRTNSVLTDRNEGLAYFYIYQDSEKGTLGRGGGSPRNSVPAEEGWSLRGKSGEKPANRRETAPWEGAAIEEVRVVKGRALKGHGRDVKGPKSKRVI